MLTIRFVSELCAWISSAEHYVLRSCQSLGYGRFCHPDTVCVSCIAVCSKSWHDNHHRLCSCFNQTGVTDSVHVFPHTQSLKNLNHGACTATAAVCNHLQLVTALQTDAMVCCRPCRWPYTRCIRHWAAVPYQASLSSPRHPIYKRSHFPPLQEQIPLGNQSWQGSSTALYLEAVSYSKRSPAMLQFIATLASPKLWFRVTNT